MEKNLPSLILLRGLPGSGKSTLANILAEEKWPICSIDTFFTNAETGEYKFEFEKNHLAYKNCQNRVKQEMENKLQKIFVDNTFTLEWELEPYFELAKQYQYKIFVVTVENRHHGSNVHHISEEQIKKMAEKYKVVLY